MNIKQTISLLFHIQSDISYYALSKKDITKKELDIITNMLELIDKIIKSFITLEGGDK